MNVERYTPEALLGPLNEVERKNAPAELFAAGNAGLLRCCPRVAIVGSRRASPNGLARARRLARFLVEHGVVVVSGLAEGIDTAAHSEAIERGGSTIAVIGTPLDQAYPRKNADLQRLICEEHLCLSQFAVDRPVTPKNFPIRNRTMALVADATVIIEAAEGSGTIHQAWEALRLGRGLFIANAILDDTSLEWPSKLIQYGASILSNETVELLIDSLPAREVMAADAAVPF